MLALVAIQETLVTSSDLFLLDHNLSHCAVVKSPIVLLRSVIKSFVGPLRDVHDGALAFFATVTRYKVILKKTFS